MMTRDYFPLDEQNFCPVFSRAAGNGRRGGHRLALPAPRVLPSGARALNGDFDPAVLRPSLRRVVRATGRVSPTPLAEMLTAGGMPCDIRKFTTSPGVGRAGVPGWGVPGGGSSSPQLLRPLISSAVAAGTNSFSARICQPPQGLVKRGQSRRHITLPPSPNCSAPCRGSARQSARS